jgi:hypothetical protein
MTMDDWRSELGGIVSGRARVTRAEQENARFEAFLDAVALPALADVAGELSGRHGRDAQVRRAPASVTLTVRMGDVEELSFRVMKRFVQTGILPCAEARLNRGQRPVKYECMFKEDPQNYPISDVAKDDIIACFIKYYKQVMDPGPGGAAE